MWRLLFLSLMLYTQLVGCTYNVFSDPPALPDWNFYELPKVDLVSDNTGAYAYWTNNNTNVPALPFSNTNSFFHFDIVFSPNILPSNSSPVLATFAAISPQGDLFHDTDSVLITESIVDFRTSFGPCASIQTNGTIIYDKVSMSLGRNSVTPNTPIGTLQPYRFYVDSQIQEKIAQYLFLIPGTYTYLTLSLGENYTDSEYFGFYLNIYLTDLNNIFFVGDIFDEIVIGDQKYCPENQTSRTKFVMANISQVTNTSVLGIIPNLQKKAKHFYCFTHPF